MGNIIKLTTFLIVLLLLVSCQEKNEKKGAEKKIVTNKKVMAIADVKKVSLNIEGMTCEIGCARTIQSKLSKTKGVKSAKVNFEEKKGVVEYDANKISEKQIIAIVEHIAGGDLYKVTDTKTSE